MKRTKVDLITVQNMNEPNLTECPYCGHDEYYVNVRYSGTGICICRFDGTETENGDIHDCLQGTIIGKFAHCCNCDKKIFRIKE